MKIKKASPVAPIPAPKDAAPTSAPVQPVAPSPAVLKLQDQVVELVAQRSAARQRLSEAHSAYLLAQSAFQSAEANVKGAEQDAQYLLGLIAQLENRQPVTTIPASSPVIQMPNSLAGVTSEPALVMQQPGNMALSPPMTRRDIAAMM
jgi:hypothetical protein